MKINIYSLYKRSKNFLRKFDLFQVLTIPLLLLLIFFSVDLKKNSTNIGVLLPLSGDFSPRAQNHLNGIKLAISHINNLGGLNNKRLTLHVRNTDENNIAEMTRELIYEKNVSAIIGGFTSRDTRVIQYLSAKALIPFLTGICTHFETAKTAVYTFRTITDDQHQFEALSIHSSNRYSIRRLAVIYDTELYGPESAQRFTEICSKHSQQVASALSFPKGTVNFKKQLDELLKTKPDALVILASAANSALIVRQAREMHFDSPIIGANQCASSEFLHLAGIYSESVITTMPYNPRVGGQKSDYFLSKYQEAYGHQADADAATGYEAVMILALALENAGTDDSTAIRDSLSALHGWDSIIGSGGFDQDGNQVRPAEIAIIKEKQTIPISMEGLF